MDKYITKKIIKYRQNGYNLEQILAAELDPDDELRPDFTRIYTELYPESTQVLEQSQIPPLRDYQITTVTKCQEEFARGASRCFIQLPTGAGKTRIMYKLIEDDYNIIPRDQTELGTYIVLAPRICLVEQHFSSTNLKNFTNMPNPLVINVHSHIQDKVIYENLKEWIKNKHKTHQPLIISGSYYSIDRIRDIFRLNNIPSPKYIFADEAHLISRWGSFQELEKFPNKKWVMTNKIIFMTATPTQKQSTNHLELWGTLINQVSIRKLIEDNILCPIETIIPNIESIKDQSLVDSTNTDDMNNTNLCYVLYKTILQSKSQKSVIFCNTQQKCKQLHLEWQKLGCQTATKDSTNVIKSFVYIGESTPSNTLGIKTEKTKDSRSARDSISSEDDIDVSNINDNMNDINGDISYFENCVAPAILFVCRKISMGYDFPPIDFIGFADPKCSRSELAQCIGRGLRSYSDPVSGYIKTKCIVFIPITPFDFDKNTISKQKHSTLFQYLQYIHDDVEFDYIIPDQNTSSREQSSSSHQKSSGDKPNIVTFKTFGFPNVSFVDINKLYVVIDECKLLGTRGSQSDGNTLIIRDKPDIKKGIGCRNMAKCFVDGQQIRHVIGSEHVRIGTYSLAENKILFDGQYYSLNKFGENHCKLKKPNRKSANINAWLECECLINGKWVSTYSLPEL